MGRLRELDASGPDGEETLYLQHLIQIARGTGMDVTAYLPWNAQPSWSEAVTPCYEALWSLRQDMQGLDGGGPGAEPVGAEPAGGEVSAQSIHRAGGRDAEGVELQGWLQQVLATAGPGRPLEEEEQRFLTRVHGEPVLGARVHEGGASQSLADTIGARAFTVGRDIFLPGAVDLNSAESAELLAHEATHVKQAMEGRIGRASGPGPALSSPADPNEQEAEQAGMRGRGIASGGLGELAPGLRALPIHDAVGEAVAQQLWQDWTELGGEQAPAVDAGQALVSRRVKESYTAADLAFASRGVLGQGPIEETQTFLPGKYYYFINFAPGKAELNLSSSSQTIFDSLCQDIVQQYRPVYGSGYRYLKTGGRHHGTTVTGNPFAEKLPPVVNIEGFTDLVNSEDKEVDANLRLRRASRLRTSMETFLKKEGVPEDKMPKFETTGMHPNAHPAGKGVFTGLKGPVARRAVNRSALVHVRPQEKALTAKQLEKLTKNNEREERRFAERSWPADQRALTRRRLERDDLLTQLVSAAGLSGGQYLVAIRFKEIGLWVLDNFGQLYVGDQSLIGSFNIPDAKNRPQTKADLEDVDKYADIALIWGIAKSLYTQGLEYGKLCFTTNLFPWPSEASHLTSVRNKRSRLKMMKQYWRLFKDTKGAFARRSQRIIQSEFKELGSFAVNLQASDWPDPMGELTLQRVKNSALLNKLLQSFGAGGNQKLKDYKFKQVARWVVDNFGAISGMKNEILPLGIALGPVNYPEDKSQLSDTNKVQDLEIIWDIAKALHAAGVKYGTYGKHNSQETGIPGFHPTSERGKDFDVLRQQRALLREYWVLFSNTNGAFATSGKKLIQREYKKLTGGTL